MRYAELVALYHELEKTSKRLEKTDIVAKFLRKADVKDTWQIMLLLEGRVFPTYDEREIGVAARIVLKALNIATGISAEQIEKTWRETGDLGTTAEKLAGKKKQATLFSSELTVDKVFMNLRKLAELTGQGTVERKIQLIAELLTSAKPLEAKYVIRTILQELRVGLGSGTVRDAIVWAFFSDDIGLEYEKQENEIQMDREKYNHYSELVQEAYDITNDFSTVARITKEKGAEGLKNVSLEIGRPLKVMLAQKVKNIEEGFETVGIPAALEFKYDGFRMQIHRNGDKITIFTRRLENVTKQFPDVVEHVKKRINSDNFIIDSEAVGYDPSTGKYLPFQSISQRIKRKYDIERISLEFPVELNVFDIIYFEGENILKKPFFERRKILEKIVSPDKRKIVLASQLTTSDAKEADKFYKSSLASGNEGVMFKNVNAPYKPGSRVGNMVKLKPTMKELDLVIVGAEWGEGKRASWITSYVLACRNEETGEFLEVGRVSTGVKEKEEEGVSYSQLTEILKPLIVAEKGKELKLRPELVIEVTYEEIQASPTYESGFALRFPRFLRIRDDRRSDEINTLGDVRQLYEAQRQR